jgi:hypothetical protein
VVSIGLRSTLGGEDRDIPLCATCLLASCAPKVNEHLRELIIRPEDPEDPWLPEGCTYDDLYGRTGPGWHGIPGYTGEYPGMTRYLDDPDCEACAALAGDPRDVPDWLRVDDWDGVVRRAVIVGYFAVNGTGWYPQGHEVLLCATHVLYYLRPSGVPPQVARLSFQVLNPHHPWLPDGVSYRLLYGGCFDPTGPLSGGVGQDGRLLAESDASDARCRRSAVQQPANPSGSTGREPPST